MDNVFNWPSAHVMFCIQYIVHVHMNTLYTVYNNQSMYIQNHAYNELTWEGTAESWGWQVSQQTDPQKSALSLDLRRLLEMWTQVEKSGGCS